MTPADRGPGTGAFLGGALNGKPDVPGKPRAVESSSHQKAVDSASPPFRACLYRRHREASPGARGSHVALNRSSLGGATPRRLFGEEIMETSRCPKCGKKYTPKVRPATTAGEYDIFTGELQAPPCLSCAKKDDKRSKDWEKQLTTLRNK
jgi:hypothetical protein